MGIPIEQSGGLVIQEEPESDERRRTSSSNCGIYNFSKKNAWEENPYPSDNHEGNLSQSRYTTPRDSIMKMTS